MSITIERGSVNTNAAQFVRLALDIARSEGQFPDWGGLAKHYANQSGCGRIESFCKAAVGSASVAETWTDSDGLILAGAFITEHAAANLATALARYARAIPDFGRRILIAEGVIASGVAEGAAKPVVQVEVAGADPTEMKVAAVIVTSKELLRIPGPSTEDLFRRLLSDAVIRASNAAVLSALSTTSVAAGANAVASLTAGLAAAGDASGFVIAATPAITRELALASDGRMGINGGDFIPGVTIVPVESTSGSPDLTVIPAGQVALRDEGLELRLGGHADIEMQTAPTSNSATPTATQSVSMFATNSMAMLCERRVSFYSNLPAVEVG